MTQRSPLSTSRATEDPLSRDPLTTFHTVSSALARRVYIRQRGRVLPRERQRRTGRIEEGGASRPLCVCEMLARDATNPCR